MLISILEVGEWISEQFRKKFYFSYFQSFYYQYYSSLQWNKNEAIVITGVKRYSNYEGYDWTLKFKSSYKDAQPLDSFGRIRRVITAIDAKSLSSYDLQINQFSTSLILRELNKATIGFSGYLHELEVNDLKLKVSTGRWGWGVFHGNAELKFLIQWIASSYNERDMEFFTFNSEDCNSLHELYEIYSWKCVGDLITDLLIFGDFVQKKL